MVAFLSFILYCQQVCTYRCHLSAVYLVLTKDPRSVWFSRMVLVVLPEVKHLRKQGRKRSGETLPPILMYCYSELGMQTKGEVPFVLSADGLLY